MTAIPEIKPLDLSIVIRQAILHGRGYPCNADTRKDITPLTDADLHSICTFDPEGLPQFDRLQELILWVWKNRKPAAEPERKSLDQLADELSDTWNRWHGSVIQHVKSGGRYKIVGMHFRESDMALCVEYCPEEDEQLIGTHRAAGKIFASRVKFARSVEDMNFGTRFVFVGGHAHGNAELDAGAPNHLDHDKRGFNPK